MFVEESQSMPIETLEEIRLLSNLETAHSKLLQIVLFGQPELEDNLRKPQIRQLRERITHSFLLSPLNPDEIRDYLNFRLRTAGYRGPDLFSESIVNAIARSSGGLTRRVNLIADKALLAAFSENTHTIKGSHVKDAVRDSEFSRYEPSRARLKIGLAVLLFTVGAGIGIALYAKFAANQNPPPLPRAPAASESAPMNNANKDVEGAAEKNAVASTEPSVTIAAEAKRSTTETAKPVLKLDKSIAGTNTQSSPQATDEVELRLAATQDWLAQVGKNPYSIQLLGADNSDQLKNHLNVIRKYIEINDIYVYRTIAKQKPSLTVLYGSFSNRSAALSALEKLPASLKAYNPLLRTLQGVRTEIARHQPS
jgi:septal ring-binding cell division protein DamX